MYIFGCYTPNTMSMIKHLIFLGLCFQAFSSPAQSYRQPENNVWISGAITGSGYGFGIDFNSGTPQSITNAWQGGIGAASVSDKNGQLLFYTDGNIIWNRNHVVMPHGWDINNDGSMNNYFILDRGWSTANVAGGYNSTVIVPMPGSLSKYYVFSIPRKWATQSGGFAEWYGHLYYTVVDMELDGGLGDVDTAQKAVLVAQDLMESITAVAGDNCNFWLLTHDMFTTNYKAFNIDRDGVDTNPVASPAGTLATTRWPLPYAKRLRISPDRRRVGLCVWGNMQVGFTSGPADSNSIIDISDFDPVTGMVSGTVTIPAYNVYDLAFSPNSSQLYLSSKVSVLQYNISIVPPWQDVRIDPDTNQSTYTSMRLAPDQKIYLAGYKPPASPISNFGASIGYPDGSGTACQFDYVESLSMITAAYGLVLFPTEVPVMLYEDTVTSLQKAKLCFNERSIRITPVDTLGYAYLWNNGEALSAITIDTPGVYTVHYKTMHPCVVHLDTIIVESVVFDYGIIGDSLSCTGEPIQLNAFPTDAQIVWSDSTAGDNFLADKSGKYKARISLDGCTVEDSMDIVITDVRQDLGRDTFLCMEAQQPFELRAHVPALASVRWSTGSEEPSILAVDSGLYWVEVTDNGCVGTDSIVIGMEYCTCPIFVPNAFSPNQDGLNDFFRPAIPSSCNISGYALQVFNRWGTLIYAGYSSGMGWDGTIRGQPADAGTYFYRLELEAGVLSDPKIYKGDVLLIR